MNITCPRCHTSFALLPEQIGINGRKVKCSNCQHIWYQKPELLPEPVLSASNKDQPIIPINKPAVLSNDHKVISNRNENLVYANKGANLPVLLPITIPQHTNLSSIILINLIFLLSYILFHEKLNIPALTKFYENKVIIENIQANHTSINHQLKVSYRITNHDIHNIIIPLIRIRLLDKRDMPIKTYILDQKDIKLSPKQHIDINTLLEIVPASSTALDITLGNNLDFILQ
ncbi:MJ0042-type zinc finger domain-containing protein [Candidatus Tisiphia endosymbiont of Nemotelus uliginosus]|uniref:MJ0042-type zinc finger domain-containing protein n=1 Tax=Candidatus Tisiphia endosymbiont of Nemotelus uliginosus TaxID=3077926 RepID=UPI0035C9252E